MSKKLALAVFGLVAIFASPGWTGSTGNGSPRPQGQFTFCYGGNVKVVYLTQIMPLAPTTDAPGLGVIFGKYVQATYGIPAIDRERCVTGNTTADLAAERKRYLGMFGKTKIVQINWAG